MNPSLNIDFKIAVPWIDVSGQKIIGRELQAYYESKKIRFYHCRNCGAALAWVQAVRSHYPCWNCKYDGDYKNNTPQIEYEI